MNDHRRWLDIILLGFLAFLPTICQAQWYQGPSGGRNGQPFDYWNSSGHSKRIKEVIVLYDSVIRCIKLVYEGSEGGFGNLVESNSPGCHAVNRFKDGRFVLDPDEYLVGVAGRYGDLIDSIRFFSSKKNSPVFGGTGGDVEFGYTATPGQKIVAFTGRASDNLDAIGVMFAPIN